MRESVACCFERPEQLHLTMKMNRMHSDNEQSGHSCFHAQKKHHPRSSNVFKNGTFNAPSGARTLDTLIKSQVLYQLS